MKNKIIIAILLILSVNAIKAQDTIKRETIIMEKEKNEELRTLELGFRVMPTFSSLSFNTYRGEVVQGEVTLSQGYGVMLGINLSKSFGIQAEADYNEISQKYKDRNLERKVKINYFNIPVMFSFNSDKTQPVNFNFVAGPQFGLNAGSSIKTTGSVNGEVDTLHAVIAVKEGDAGIAYGAGFEFGLNKSRSLRLDLGFRGFYGLVDMTSKNINNDPDTYNIIVTASRKTYAGYGGITLLF